MCWRRLGTQCYLRLRSCHSCQAVALIRTTRPPPPPRRRSPPPPPPRRFATSRTALPAARAAARFLLPGGRSGGSRTSRRKKETTGAATRSSGVRVKPETDSRPLHLQPFAWRMSLRETRPPRARTPLPPAAFAPPTCSVLLDETHPDCSPCRATTTARRSRRRQRVFCPGSRVVPRVVQTIRPRASPRPARRAAKRGPHRDHARCPATGGQPPSEGSARRASQARSDCVTPPRGVNGRWSRQNESAEVCFSFGPAKRSFDFVELGAEHTCRPRRGDGASPCEAPRVASVSRRGYRHAGMAHRVWSGRF